MSDVKVLARWDGWCDPCEVERPLVLTETGERGLRAWLRGVGAEDRALTLTCGVCGAWQVVPRDEADDSAPAVLPDLLVAIRRLGAHSVTVHTPAYPAEALPAPRTESYLPGPSLELLQELELLPASA